MKCIRVNNINIIFDDNTKEQALEFAKIIDNNKLLFTEILGKKKYSFINYIPDAYYINDLEQFINKIIDDNFYTEEQDANTSKYNQSFIVYLGYIVVEGLSKEKLKDLYSTNNGIKDTIDVLGESLYRKEIYEDILIKEYFDEFGTKEDFIRYIKTKENKEELISKIKDKYRFKAYNYVLENIVDYLKECGYFEPENMIEICANIHFNMRERTLSKFVDSEELNKKLKELPKLNRIKLDKYFRGFLKEINKDGILLEIYKDAIRKKKIKFNKNYKGSYCVIKDDSVTLEIKETGTIEDFYSLSHEFMHYVSHTYNKDSIPFALEEFPSIFFEKYALDFLEKNGYSKESVEVLHDFRFNDIKEKSFGMLNFLIADIIDKTKGKEVTDKRLREYLLVLNKIIKKKNEEDEKTEDIDLLSQEEIDDYIKAEKDQRPKSYFVWLIEYVEAFRYTISSYLAFNIYEKLKEDNILIEKVIEYVLYANKPTFKDTIELFGIENDYEKLLRNIEKQKQKVLNKNNN